MHSTRLCQVVSKGISFPAYTPLVRHDFSYRDADAPRTANRRWTWTRLPSLELDRHVRLRNIAFTAESSRTRDSALLSRTCASSAGPDLHSDEPVSLSAIVTIPCPCPSRERRPPHPSVGWVSFHQPYSLTNPSTMSIYLRKRHRTCACFTPIK